MSQDIPGRAPGMSFLSILIPETQREAVRRASRTFCIETKRTHTSKKKKKQKTFPETQFINPDPRQFIISLLSLPSKWLE
jgi:hypothetical protein